MTSQRRRTIELVLTLAGPLFLLALWEILSRSGVLDARFWPPPSSLWNTAVDLVLDGSLLTNVRVSLGRILVGFALGAIPAVLLGLLMGLSWPVRVALMPVAAAIYAIPKIAVVPLILLIFGVSEAGKYVIVALSIFFLVLLNTMAGVLAIDRSFQDVARNFGAGPVEMFLTVALPGALPSIFTGLRLGIGFSLIVIVGTEFIAAREGIGRFIYDSYQILAISKMFIGLIVTGIMGWLLTISVDLVERLVIPWKPAA
jgi:NitT/TauT family transport system permease protein